MVFVSPVGAFDFYDYINLNITPIPCKVDHVGGDRRPITNDLSAGNCPVGFNRFYTRDGQIILGQYGEINLTNPEFRPPNTKSYNVHKAELNADSAGKQPDVAPEYCAEIYANPTPAPAAAGAAAAAATPLRDFVSNPRHNHFWAEDQDVTALGKANERARQFLVWALSRPGIDDNPELKRIWAISRNVAISILILMAAVLGLWTIAAQKLRYRLNGEFGIWRSIFKIAASLLYISLSAALILTMVQLSEVLMKFFIESLAGKDLFNVYFSGSSAEANYVGFIGCRDLNIRVKEAAETQMFLLRATNVSYYVMGIMIVVRKILLWFLLFVSPFLPILLSFPLIRNTGKIWIGVFFQWLFYGPLLALFLGATGAIWKYGIPYPFDFSRINSYLGYVYPTAIIITYGGPAQKGSNFINAFNNGNYVDTFAEYVISLVMLWAVTWFPWWLLRIFRDDCCEAIMSMAVAFKGLGESLRPSPPPKAPPPLQPIKTGPTPKYDSPVDLSKETISKIGRVLKLSDHNQVRTAHTTEIVRAMSLQATTLKDVARLETNKTMVQTAKQNFALLQNPLAATSATEREKYLNVRTELFTRATSKNDAFARYVLSTASRSSQEHVVRREEMIKSIQNVVNKMETTAVPSIVESTASQTHIAGDKITSVTNNVINNITNNSKAVQTIASRTNTPPATVKQILGSYAAQLTRPMNQVMTQIASITQTSTDKVREVLKETQQVVSRSQIVQDITRTTKVEEKRVTQLLKEIDKVTEATRTPAAPQVSRESAGMISQISRQILTQTQAQPGVIARLQTRTGLTESKIQSTLTSLASSTSETLIQQASSDNELTTQQTETLIKETAKIATETAVPIQTTTGGVSLEKTSELLREISDTKTIITERPVAVPVTLTPQTVQIVNQVTSRITNAETQEQDRIISTLAQATHLTKEQTSSVVQSLAHTSTSQMISEVSQETAVSAPQVASVIQAISTHEMTTPLLRQVVDAEHEKDLLHEITTIHETTAPALSSEATTMISSIAQSTISQSQSDTTLIERIASQTQLTQSQILTTLQTLSQDSSLTSIQTISETQNITTPEIASVIQEAAKVAAPTTETVVTPEISERLMSEVHDAVTQTQTATPGPLISVSMREVFTNEKVSDFTREIIRHTLTDESVLSAIQKETGLSHKQVESTLQTLSTASSITDTKVLEHIKTEYGVEPVKALSMVNEAVKQTNIATDVLPTAGTDVSTQDQAQIIQEQLETAVNPDSQIDQMIPMPEDQALDEYEEIRQLWVDQYESGEVPVSDDVHTRLDWVRQDQTIMTNILNKLVSKDEKLRQQALDEVGFILPVFLINNLNGAQLMTYLKAKLSAAKQVNKQLTKKEAEAAAAAAEQAASEDLVEVNRQATATDENTKHLEVDESGEAREAKG